MHSAQIDEERKIVTDARPSKFAHIVLVTSRYEEMEKFYKTLLLAEPAFRNDYVSFLRYDDEHHRVVLTKREGLVDRPVGASRTHHISFTYSTLGQLLGTYERLGPEGIAPVWCINHGITTSIYYSDPDGMFVETQYDHFGMEEADAFMRSDYFRVNPIGVDFDPALLRKRYENGDRLEELIKQGSAPLPEDVEPVRPPDNRPGGDYDYRGKLLANYPG